MNLERGSARDGGTDCAKGSDFVLEGLQPTFLLGAPQEVVFCFSFSHARRC